MVFQIQLLTMTMTVDAVSDSAANNDHDCVDAVSDPAVYNDHDC